MRVAAAGGMPQPFTKLDSSKGARGHRWPKALPGGKAVLFNVLGDATGNTYDVPICLALLKTGEVKTLPLRGTNVRYVPGYVVFTRGETLYAAPFDLQRLEVTGSPFPAEDVLISPFGPASYSVSESGSFAYVPSGASIGKLVWVDAKGTSEVPGLPTRDYYNRVQISPDGKRIVVVILEGGMRHIWVYDTVRQSLTRLTLGDSDNSSPTWSRDGRRIVFARLQEGKSSIVAKQADGSGSEEIIVPGQKSATVPGSWSPDERLLGYSQIGSSGKWDSGVLPVEGERKPQVLLASNQFNQLFPIFSPDGKYLAYTSDESGRYEVYVIPFGQGSGSIMGVDVTTQPVFNASTPRLIVPSAVTAPLSNGVDNYDVSLDGRRFLVHQQNSEAGQSLQINVILNWSEELRQLSPAGKN